MEERKDTISRQAAIDLVEGLESAWLKGKIDLLYPKVVKGLLGLPSAQPEEDCNTCKHGYFGDDQCNNCRVRYLSHYERRTDEQVD